MNFVSGVEPNFEDLDLVVDQADGETVDVDQADPHSNNIHVAHNNPKNRCNFNNNSEHNMCKPFTFLISDWIRAFAGFINCSRMTRDSSTFLLYSSKRSNPL